MKKLLTLSFLLLTTACLEGKSQPFTPFGSMLKNIGIQFINHPVTPLVGCATMWALHKTLESNIKATNPVSNFNLVPRVVFSTILRSIAIWGTVTWASYQGTQAFPEYALSKMIVDNKNYFLGTMGVLSLAAAYSRGKQQWKVQNKTGVNNINVLNKNI